MRLTSLFTGSFVDFVAQLSYQIHITSLNSSLTTDNRDTTTKKERHGDLKKKQTHEERERVRQLETGRLTSSQLVAGLLPAPLRLVLTHLPALSAWLPS